MNTVLHTDRPSKQGAKYQLSLGQNDGPYLTKDIMITNKKSLRLLTGNEIAKSTAQSILAATTASALSQNHVYEPQEVYDPNIKGYTNYDEKYKSKLSGNESLIHHGDFQHQLLAQLQKDLQEYKNMIAEYKSELRSMNDKVNAANSENLKTLQPLMREFHGQLKESLQEEKTRNYQFFRDIEQLNRDKSQIQQNMLFSENRIQEIEKAVGVSAKDMIDINATERYEYSMRQQGNSP